MIWIKRRIPATGLIFLMLLSVFCLFGEADTTGSALTKEVSGNTYADYYSRASVERYPDGEAVWKADGDAFLGESSLKVEEKGSRQIALTVAESGLYAIEMRYCAINGSSNRVQMSLSINGELPFDEAENILLSRYYQNDGEVIRDNQGNDQAPYQLPVEKWQTVTLNGEDNYTGDCYFWRLEAGENRLDISAVQGSFAIHSLRAYQPDSPLQYSEYIQQYEGYAGNTLGFCKNVEAETAVGKSNSNLAPVLKNGDPDVSPSHPYYNRVNAIGGDGWSRNGQWIEWELEVPQDGLYHLGFMYQQTYVRGMEVFRRLRIDGMIPFAEANAISFQYGKKWQYLELGIDDKPCAVYLSEGKHTLRLEATLGDRGTYLQQISDIADELNTLYRKIIMITGVSPDPYNDYYLHIQIPELRDIMEQNVKSLERIAGQLEEVNGSELSTLYDIARLLKRFIKKPDLIPDSLSTFEADIRALYTLRLNLASQPLLLDFLVLRSTGSETYMPKQAGFAASVVYRAKSFIHSFLSDYQIGDIYEDEGEALTVWLSSNDITITGVSSGRDQAVTIKRMIDEDFYGRSKIPVNLKLVNTSESLLMAVASNNAPDVTMFVPKAVHTNLAIRGALMDLEQCRYMNDWKSRVFDSAFIPYTYKGGIYGMPELQMYNLLYYRKDIMGDLGLNVPNTWEEFYDVTAALQGRHLEVGVPTGLDSFYMLLFQNGGSVYSSDLSSVDFSDPKFVDAFSTWTDLYNLNGISLSYDFFNRFRSGQMPLGIASMTMYNQLAAAAPEIDNLWSIAPVPGTPDRNGNINRSVSCTTTASVVFSNTKMPDEAFAFVDWWTSDEIQAQFAGVIEDMMGVSSRYYSANKKTMQTISWTQDEYAVLEAMQPYVTDVPPTAAYYYLDRTLNNAFRRVTYYSDNPQETLVRYNKEMNDELKRKRKEFE